LFLQKQNLAFKVRPRINDVIYLLEMVTPLVV